MFLITSNSSVVFISKTEEVVKAHVSKMVADWESHFELQKSTNNSWFLRHYPSKESYISVNIKSIFIYKFTGGSAAINWRNRYNEAVDGLEDITSSYWTSKEEETIVGRKYTADVVKKGLKSFGQRVEVLTKVGDRMFSKADAKELYDKLAKVTVLVDGWGKISMSPAALDNYGYEDIVRKVQVVTIVE